MLLYHAKYTRIQEINYNFRTVQKFVHFSSAENETFVLRLSIESREFSFTLCNHILNPLFLGGKIIELSKLSFFLGGGNKI